MRPFFRPAISPGTAVCRLASKMGGGNEPVAHPKDFADSLRGGSQVLLADASALGIVVGAARAGEEPQRPGLCGWGGLGSGGGGGGPARSAPAEESGQCPEQQMAARRSMRLHGVV